MEPDEPRAAVGKLLPNCEAKIMSLDGTSELGPNQSGELWVRSPNVTKGYLKRPQLTSKAFLADGWLRTGDLACYDSRNNWYIKDRIEVRIDKSMKLSKTMHRLKSFTKDLIHGQDGLYALPTDLESVLLDISGVRDAGVTAVESYVLAPLPLGITQSIGFN